MSRARSRGAVVVVMLVTACAEATTEPSVHLDPASGGLDLLFPDFDRAMLVSGGTAQLGEPSTGSAARVVSEGEEVPAPEVSEEELSSLYAAIYDARTIAGVGSGQAWARGEHSYQGNKGRIETTVDVAFEGQSIGSQRAVTENARSFVFDFGLVKYISALARVYTDRECGLSASGRSEHSAWWEAVIGGSASVHGRAARTTQSSLARTPDCPPNDGGGVVYGGLIQEGGASYCWVSIWYDMWTGEIIHLDVLYCS